MPLKLQVIHAKEFVQMTPDGEFDFDSTKDLLIKAVSIESKSSELEILLDFRQAHANLTTTDIWYLAAALDEHKASFKEKIAVLVSVEHKFSNAKFFELCATNRGLDVGAFNSYEDAITWLFPSSESSGGADGQVE